MPTIHRLIDGLAGRTRADLVEEITSQFPVQVIAGVLGVPSEDHGRFHTWALDMNKGPDDYPVSTAASAAMRAYLTPIVEDRKAHPTDDLISDIVTAEIDGERLDDEHIYGFLRLLLPAGAETTFAAMGNCLFALLDQARSPRARAERPVPPRRRGGGDAALGDLGHHGQPGDHLSGARSTG